MIATEDIDEVVQAMREGWIMTGPRAARFESEFAGYVGAPAALPGPIGATLQTMPAKFSERNDPKSVAACLVAGKGPPRLGII